VVGLGQPEATDALAARERGQVLAPLGLAAVREDREHDERALHAHHRAVAGIDALDLARDETVADVVQPGAAVFGRQRRAEQTERTHLGKDRRIDGFVPESIAHAR